jgi:eukaryotic-like serine/threonine-protein kinase
MTNMADAASEEFRPVIPDHEILRLISSGSSGQVWLAKNALGTFRAVKIVHARPLQHRRLSLEFQGILKFEPISRLHDGLVDILQVGSNDQTGYFYYVMELADDIALGRNIAPETYQPRTLAHHGDHIKRFPVAECVRHGAAIASALGFLHKHGLIHRDIKPSNIIFVNGIPKLADIGLVTDMSEAGSPVGTEGFIPAEGSGSIRADIYSLGKVLYEMSTGKDRNDYPTLPDELEYNAEAADVVLLNKIILKACRAKAWHRYQTAEEMLSALLTFQFDREKLRQAEDRRLFTRWIGIIGAIVAVSVIIGLLGRILWLLEHGR